MPYFNRCGDLRERAGIAKSVLAKIANVDRQTIARVENGHSARRETLIRVINALNDLYYREKDISLDHNNEISVKGISDKNRVTALKR